MSVRVQKSIWIAIGGACLALSACSSGNSGSAMAPTTNPPSPPPAPPPPPPPPPPDFDTAEYQASSNLAQINALPAYDAGASGQNIIVSIIDSGIDVNNPEFDGRIHPQSADLVAPGIVPSGDLRPGGPDLQDQDNHGTAVASIIGAARDGVGIHGVAPEATLLIFRADDDSPDEDILYGEAISEGVDRSITIGAGVVNMSFGSDEAAARGQFRQQLTDLKNADIVTVLAAGNDGDAGPDESALGAFDVPGAPAAIVAGAVSADNNIASFSDRAGAAADIYLVAPGRLIETTGINTTPGQTRLFSGTSASTPHIAGAAALVRSLWPQLTAEEVVEILLDSATDLGDPGTDPVYGRGLLNVGAAVSPMGAVTTSSINGDTAPVESIGGTLSGAFGAGLRSLGEIVVFDRFNRDFRTALGGGVTQSAPVAFNLEQRFNPFTSHSVSNVRVNNRWSMQLQMTTRDQSATSLINHQVAFENDIAGDAAHWQNQQSDIQDHTLAFAMSGGVSERVSLVAANGFTPAQLDRNSAPTKATPFLSDHAFTDTQLPKSTDATTVMMRMNLSARLSLDMLLTHGEDDSPDRGQAVLFDLSQAQERPTASVMRLGANVTLGSTSLRVEQGLRRENGSVLGAKFAGSNSATTIYSAIEGGWALGRRWHLQSRLAAGLTFADGLGFDAFTDGTTSFTTTQMSLALRREGIFSDTDTLWLGVSQPLQVESGALNLLAPTGFDQRTETITYTALRAPLSAEARQLDIEAGYRLLSGPLGAVDMNIIHQTFGQFDLPPQTTALIRGQFRF